MTRKKPEVDWSRAGRKSWDTRLENIRHADYKRRGHKASDETRKPSEYNYIREIAKTLSLKRNCIFHHEGIPDIMVITKGKMRFYEIKPKKGALVRKMLNRSQIRTIRELLKHDYIEEVNLVRYEKKGKQIVYDKPIKLTKRNLKEYSY